jgi:hypothetical protein
VPALVTPSETLSERVDRLVSSRGDSWPPLHSTAPPAAIAGIIEHIDGLEEAIREMAQEVERLTAENDRLEAQPIDD